MGGQTLSFFHSVFVHNLLKTYIPRRYLWTDAFAVCNFLELYRHTSDEKHLSLRLVDQVHSILGRHREDEPAISCDF